MKSDNAWRLVGVFLIVVVALSACSPFSQGRNEPRPEDGEQILHDAVDNMAVLTSFRMDIHQGGTPYRFYFQLGPTGLQFATEMTTAESAYIAPDRMWANILINIRGLLVNVGLFATSQGQWLKPLSADWLAYEYAPGFNPADMMSEDDGFHRAIARLDNLEFLGYETRKGVDVYHVRGTADRDTVNTILFGLLTILEELALVDVYIDTGLQIPIELVLTLPDTSIENAGDTFWQIEFFDFDEQFDLDHPAEVPPITVRPTPSAARDYGDYLVWIMGFSALIGAVVTPVAFRNKGHSSALGLVVGGVAGAFGSAFLLLPLWLLTPSRVQKPGRSAAEIKKTQEMITEALATLNPWVVMGFIAIPVFVGSLDLTVVSAFLPELVSELGLAFDTGLDDASWVVTSYLLAYTISLTFMGRLSDLVGRKIVYIGCLLVFIVGSVWVAIAHTWPADLLFQFYRSTGQRPDPGYINLQVIIAGRVVSALGAGALVPVSLALVGDIFPPDQRGRPLGFVAAMDTLGWVLGPVYGGLLMQIMPWQGLFWINVPLTFLALFSVIFALRNVPMLRVHGHFDYIGTALIIGGLSAMSIGLGANVELSSGSAAFDDLRPLPAYAPQLLTAAGVLFVGFILAESRIKDPLINLGMFKRRNLWTASLVNLLVGYCLFVGLVSVPLLVNIRQDGVSTLSEAALRSGLLLSTLTLPMAAAAVPGGWLSDRVGIRSTIMLGLGMAVVGFGLMWQTWSLEISNWFLSLQMALVGTGIGLTFSPVSAAIINSAYDEERGVASALVIILRLIGMTVSISTLSSVMYYRVNALAAVAANAAGAFDPQALLVIYTDVAVKVLGEMGLVGAVLAAIALVPAYFIGQHVISPQDNPETSNHAER